MEKEGILNLRFARYSAIMLSKKTLYNNFSKYKYLHKVQTLISIMLGNIFTLSHIVDFTIFVSIFLSFRKLCSNYFFVRIINFLKLAAQVHGCNPVSWFVKEFEWTLFSKSRFVFSKELYDKTIPRPFGIYFPNIFKTKHIITKLELIETVSKKFKNFAFRPRSTYLENDPLTHSIFNLDGKKWESWRKHLSRAFSTEKLSGMFPLIDRSAEETIRLTSFDLSERNDVVIDIMRISRSYVLTVFYSCVFNQEITPMDSNSEFGKMAKKLRNKNSSRFKFFDILNFIRPNRRHLFGGHINSQGASDYFRRLISSAADKKKEFDDKDYDFLSTFMRLEHNSSGEAFKWDRSATEAHCVVFLLGGFTATSSMIAFTLYELAKNVDIQERLRQEVDEFTRNANGSTTFENIKSMVYLDKVISESLRKYPPFSVNVRICSEKFESPEDNWVVNEGETVIIPVSGLHHDPKYYPIPDLFDPERFSEERIRPPSGAYIPFGQGPRNCIGQRFALLVAKDFVIKFLLHFRLSIIAGRETLPKFLPRKFTTTVSEIQLHCVRRN